MDTQEMLFEDLAPMRTKRAAVIVMRAQPPTIGHYMLIDSVKKFIRENKNLKLCLSPIIVLIGGSKTDKHKSKNPLSLKDRELFMTASGRCNGCIFLSAPNAFAAFAAVREDGYEPIAVAAGSDRAEGYENILNKYFKTDDEKPIDHYIIAIDRDESSSENATTGNMDDEFGENIDMSKVSGSLARRAAELDYKDEFNRMVGLEPALAEKLYDKVKKGMNET